MPVFTTLEFFRSKQTISSFDKVYPKSMSGLRDAILDSLKTIDNMLLELTHQYLEGHVNYESFIISKAANLHLLLRETDMAGIYKNSDFEILIDRASFANVPSEQISGIKEISKQILEYNPNAFIPIVELIEKIISCMEKYFLSFYIGNTQLCPSKYVETLYNYENKRLKIPQEIKQMLRKIFIFSNQFNKQGLKISDLGDNSNQIARKSKSMEMPCFLLFPESCDLIQESRNLLSDWIETDKEYPNTIKMDIENMNNEKVKVDLEKRTEYEDFIKSRHHTDQLQREYNEMQQLKSAMEKKLERCEEEEYKVLILLKLNESTIDRTELAIKNLKNKNYLDNNEKSEMNEHQYTLVKTNKAMDKNKTQLQKLELKIKWYRRFGKALLTKKSQLDISIRKTNSSKIKLDDLCKHSETIEEYMKYLHLIYAVKSSNSTLKKIFYNLDLKTKTPQLPFTEKKKSLYAQDELSYAIHITSQMIDKDWIKLYTNLPFHPPRGTTEIEKDIEKFIKIQVRGLREQLALQSLQSWRRTHIRANLKSLVEALQSINRHDIIQKLGYLSKPKQEDSIKRIEVERLPPMSATSKFLIRHYPNLKKSNLMST